MPMTSSSPSLSVVVPCFNEQGNIRNTLESIFRGIAPLRRNCEIILIDDCSTDQTKSVIQELEKSHPEVRAIYNAVNKGFGYNLRLGYQSAAGEYVILIPGDNE